MNRPSTIFCLLSIFWVGPSVAFDTNDISNVAAAEAIKHVGDFRRVCGQVAEISEGERMALRPVFLRFSKPRPEHDFMAVIMGEDVQNFATMKVRALRGKDVCVTGTIDEYRGMPQMILISPDQVSRN